MFHNVDWTHIIKGLIELRYHDYSSVRGLLGSGLYHSRYLSSFVLTSALILGGRKRKGGGQKRGRESLGEDKGSGV